MRPGDRYGGAVLSVVVFGLVAAVGTTPMGIIAAGALMASAIVERRSVPWVLIAGVLAISGSALAVIAAVALPAAWTERHLRYQPSAALRRSVAAGLNPTLLIGAAVGSYRGGSTSRDLWWLVGWMPAIVTAAVGFTLWHSLANVTVTVTVTFAGVLLSLDSILPALARPDAVSPTPSRDTAARLSTHHEAKVDWRRVVGAPEAVTGRPPKAQIVIPDNAAALQQPSSSKSSTLDSDAESAGIRFSDKNHGGENVKHD